MTPDSQEIAQQILGKVTEFAGHAMGRVDVVAVGRKLEEAAAELKPGCKAEPDVPPAEAPPAA